MTAFSFSSSLLYSRNCEGWALDDEVYHVTLTLTMLKTESETCVRAGDKGVYGNETQKGENSVETCQRLFYVLKCK